MSSDRLRLALSSYFGLLPGHWSRDISTQIKSMDDLSLSIVQAWLRGRETMPTSGALASFLEVLSVALDTWFCPTIKFIIAERYVVCEKALMTPKDKQFAILCVTATLLAKINKLSPTARLALSRWNCIPNPASAPRTNDEIAGLQFCESINFIEKQLQEQKQQTRTTYERKSH